MTHAELVARAAQWLKNTLHCRAIITEHRAYTVTGEVPDVIGWVGGNSVLVECKTSRADYFADQKKIARHDYCDGIGGWRFYLAPQGVLDGIDIKDGWGLYEVQGGRVCYARGRRFYNATAPPFVGCKDSEIALLVSRIAKLEGALL